MYLQYNITVNTSTLITLIYCIYFLLIIQKNTKECKRSTFLNTILWSPDCLKIWFFNQNYVGCISIITTTIIINVSKSCYVHCTVRRTSLFPFYTYQLKLSYLSKIYMHFHNKLHTFTVELFLFGNMLKVRYPPKYHINSKN